MGWIKNLIFVVLAFLAVVFGAVLYWHNSSFLLFGPDQGFLLTKDETVRHSAYLPAFYIHIATGSVVLMAGIIQLSRGVRMHYTKIHRSAGKIYIATVLVLTAPSGLVMAFYANGGLSAQLCFGILALLWWFFTWRGWQSAMQMKWKTHRDFMVRSYALTFAAVTLRLYSFLFALYGLRGEDIYNVIVWLSWVPSLAFAEMWLRYAPASKNKFAAQ